MDLTALATRGKHPNWLLGGVFPTTYILGGIQLWKKRKYLEEIERTIQAGPYQDSWESLCQHVTPKWYKNDKFGNFYHWGVYSVPAFGNEWYARYVYRKNSPENKFHIKKYGV